MKRTITTIFSVLLVTSLILVSCKKSESTDDQKETNPCGDKNVCFKVDDLSFSFNAKWLAQAQDKYKIYFNQSLGGTSNERLDIIIKCLGGLKTGDYQFIDFNTPLNDDRKATFEYYKNEAGELTQFRCESGTLKITKYEDQTISGTFTCAAKDKDDNAVILKSGNLYQVKN
ncbi:MAG: hypothetical protein J5I91_08340 [Bacteroidetes bacterium]|nr:hypothetical protein [Bacteroidota bacterium]